jgi:phosphocarrier protein FPr/phosphocarrier protein
MPDGRTMTAVRLVAPLAGWLMSVRDVPDPVFAEEMMGVGFAIDPVDGTVTAPCDAEVLLVAETQHSVTLRTDSGAELLIHIGLETVALGGRGFSAKVRDGDRVAAGDPLILFDLDAVGLEAKSLATPVILTNADEHRLVLEPLDRVVERGEAIGAIEPAKQMAPAQSVGGAPASAECLIGSEHGLHARPAARVADTAKRFTSDITIEANGKSASARSPTALMGLNVKKGDRVTVIAAGEDSGAALDALAALLTASEAETKIARASAPPKELADNEIGGICAMPGTAVGPAFRWRRHVADVPEQGQGTDVERTALDQAIAGVSASLNAAASEVTGAGADVARAHHGLLQDDDLQAAAAAEIGAGKSAAFAWKAATSAAAHALRETGNPRMQERVADLEDVCAQVIAALQGDAFARPELPEGAILIAEDLLPSELLSLDRRRLAGIATERGGATSHMAIIAASFGVPTLVATGPELSRVQDGTRVLLDSTAGKLVIEPDEGIAERSLARALPRQQAGEAGTRDGHRITLFANLGGLNDVEPALAAGAEGCGLLRTEFLFLDRADAPRREEQLRTYQAIADALGPRPLTIRTLDIGGDKPVPFIRFPDEENPALGARGVRTRLIEPELIDEQLRAIAEVESDGLKVMVPMVVSAAELRGVRERMSELSGGKSFRLGAMVETPAAALTAGTLAQEADFLSIGSNDLAQYALAMDRTNPLLAPSIDALHPAVLRLIAMTADAGTRTGTPVSLCGGLASDPVGALVLVGLGVRELSSVPAALPLVRGALAQVTIEACRDMAQRALGLESAADVRALAAELLNSNQGA